MYSNEFINRTCSLSSSSACLSTKLIGQACAFREVEVDFTNKLRIDNQIFTFSKKLISVNQKSLNYSVSNQLTNMHYPTQDVQRSDIDTFMRIAEEEYIEPGFESDAEVFVKQISTQKGDFYAAKMLAEIIDAPNQVAVDAALHVLAGSDERIYRPITEHALSSIVDRASSELLERIIDICDIWKDTDLLNKISEEASERLTGGVKHYLALVVRSVHDAAAHA